MTTATALGGLGVLTLLVAACGVGGDDDQTQARLIEQAGFTPADDQAQDESLLPVVDEQAAAGVDTTTGVLRIEIPADGSATPTSIDSLASTDPDSVESESLDSESESVESESATSTTQSSTVTSAPTETSAPTTEAPGTTKVTASEAPTSKAPTTAAPAPTAAPTTVATTTPPTTVAPATAAPTTAKPTTTQPPSSSSLTYKGILAAGDNEITAFDSARKKIKSMFLADGVQAGNLIELSRQSSEQVNGVRATSVDGIERAMADLNVGEGDACIVFITSHGSTQAWFVRGSNGLTPTKLDQILSASCGERPTVALISACYSGIFINPLARSNRVILTAASATNTSFGCSPEATYTYWDGCLINNFAQASTWEDLYSRVTGCIEGKESAAGVTPSRPQAHFGSQVTNLSILNR